jgi:hypothetical protein
MPESLPQSTLFFARLCFPRLCLALLAIGVATCVPATASAEDTTDSKITSKLTLGGYRFADSGNAADLNLRTSGDFGDLWLGYYQSAKRDEHQGRFGWDRTFALGDIRLIPSAQIASRGYTNWSIGLETGETWFVGAGFGRTNLKPNWNLNFDPNDAWSIAGGYRRDGESFSLLWVRDDRENPDQRHMHAVYRKSLAEGHRLTLDILHKRGLVDGESIRKTGASLSYDWPRFFVKLAFDPKVNFTNEDMWRMSVGARF